MNQNMAPGYYFLPKTTGLSSQVFFTDGIQINSGVYRYYYSCSDKGGFTHNSRRATESILILPATDFNLADMPNATTYPELFL